VSVGRPSVLLVEDDAQVLGTLREAFVDAGFEVHVAHDGAQALTRYRQRRPDIVVTDVLMPKQSGIELSLQLLREDPAVKIVVLSGAVGARFLEAGREIGVKRVFEKPINLPALISAVRQVLQEP
jgi:CheY-like chemotaxis protein